MFRLPPGGLTPLMHFLFPFLLTCHFFGYGAHHFRVITLTHSYLPCSIGQIPGTQSSQKNVMTLSPWFFPYTALIFVSAVFLCHSYGDVFVHLKLNIYPWLIYMLIFLENIYPSQNALPGRNSVFLFSSKGNVEINKHKWWTKVQWDMTQVFRMSNSAQSAAPGQPLGIVFILLIKREGKPRDGS